MYFSIKTRMKESNTGESLFKLIPFALGVFISTSASAQLDLDMFEVSLYHLPAAEHCEQDELMAITDPEERFLETFECGDELFATTFNALDGVGANVGDGQRFSKSPRADRIGLGEWADHFPARSTGPNAEACTTCHNQPFEDGAGVAGLNVIRDPFHTGNPGQFINRNTPHVFSGGALQLLAEEMTTDLRAAVETARQQACGRTADVGQNANDDRRNGRRGRGDRGRGGVTVELSSKGVNFGSVTISCNGNMDTSELEGVDEDLLVKPFQWKGNFATLRDFNRDASHNELGMQSVEVTGDGVDGDGDGIVNEMTIGDQTAFAIYLAAQPRPVSLLELNAVGVVELTTEQIQSIRNGEIVFEQIGCADCHRPSLLVNKPTFSEPSQHPAYRDEVFPAGQDPISNLVDAFDPVSFDITHDQENVVEFNGQEINLGSFETNADGAAIVRLYGDLKRHDMGPGLAENIDETGAGASVWITAELWGVGSTAPYLHDGRATTLTEAILAHGGEALESRNATEDLSYDEHVDLINFLNSLVLFKTEEE